jgi:hypothetical protein
MRWPGTHRDDHLEGDEFGINPRMSDAEWRRAMEAAHRQTLRERRRIIGLQRKQFLAVVLMGLLLIAAGFIYGGHLSSNTTKSEERHAALRSYQIASCTRANESRASENRSHRDDYLFDTTLASLLRISLSQPSSPNPRLTPAQQTGDLELVEQFVGHLEGYAADKEWRELIPDCEYAVDHPATYVLPAPVKFAKRMPPASALEVQGKR